MLNIAELQGLNPYRITPKFNNLYVKRIQSTQETYRQKQNESNVKNNEKYEVPENEKTEWEKLVGTIIDVAA